MTTRQTAAFLTVALMTAVGANAQTPTPAPKPNPNPIQVPVTPPVVAIPDIPMSADWPMLRVDLDAIRATANDAMERARLAMADARLDMFDAMDWQSQTPLLLKSPRNGNEAAYIAGKDMLAARKYAEAIAQFDRVVAQKAANVDGALYWKAYAQFKLGKSDDAVATIAALRKDFASSRYLTDAKVLEADARRRAGQPVNPASMDDDELKLLAINGIKQTDPERAIPLLEGVLSSTNSLRVKKQALYVLATISNPKAREILLSYAKGAGNPDLQIEAIRYVATGSDKAAVATQLMQIYQGTQDTDVRLAVIGALRASGDHNALFTIAKSGDPLTLRSSALKGAVISPVELWALYEKETNKELKTQIAGLFGSMGATDQVMRIIKSEKDQDIVRRAIRSLGSQPPAKTGQLLVDLYASDQSEQTRMSVISALESQDNAEGLVAIARKEGSLTLKKEIVRSLANMAPRSKVAADYLTEIIK